MSELLDEAGQELESPPEGDNAPGSQSDQAKVTETAAETSTPARVESKPVDKDAEAFERLSNQETVHTIRQTPAKAAPSSKSTQDGTPQPKVDQPVKTAETSYEGIDAKAVDALRRAQLLPDVDAWGEMGSKTRASLVATARRVLASQGRIGQQLGQQATNQPIVEQTGDELEQQPVEEQQQVVPPRGQQRGVRAEAQRPAGQATAAPPDAFLDALKPVSEYFGDEVAAPILSAFQQQQQVIAQFQQQAEEANHQLAQQVYLPQERAAWKGLEEALPENRKLSADEKLQIRTVATTFFHASANDANPLTWQDACEIAGRSILQPDTKQAAQAALLSRRGSSLRSSPSRGASKPADRPITQDDRDQRAFALLESGRTREEARAGLR